MAAAEQVTPPPEGARILPAPTPVVVSKILEFIEAFTATSFYNYQKVFASRIIDSVLCRDGEIITGLWSRQSGKSEAVANVSVGLCVILPAMAREFPDDPRFQSFAKGFRVGIFAPILEQATIPYGRMRDAVNRPVAGEILADQDFRIQITKNSGDTVAFSNGSMARARSASEDSQIEGGTYHLVILEEAQRLSRSKVNKEISPMLASTSGSMVKIGTAWMSKGGFHTSITTNIETERNGGKRNHFEFPYDLVIREKRARYDAEVKASGTGNVFHLNYEKWITKEIKRLGGTDSDEFKMNFRLMWHETRAAAVKSGPFFAAAQDGKGGKFCREYGDGIPPGWIVIAGLDVGKTNDDSVLSVVAVNPIEIFLRNDEFELRALTDDEKDFKEMNTAALNATPKIYREKWLINILEMTGEFEGDEGQYQQVLEFLSQYPTVRVLCVDSTGLGDPVAERLAVLLPSVHVLPFKFSIGTKAVLYKHYLKELHEGRFKYPAGPRAQEDIRFSKFQQQHLDLDKKLVQGHVVVSHSDESGHDDYPDSCALACWAENVIDTLQDVIPEVEVSEGPFSGIAGSRNHRYKSGRR